VGRTDVTNALKDLDQIEITVTGRRSGRDISLPVWFVQEGDALHLVPITGSNSNWYKNVEQARSLQVSVRGQQMTARATPVTDPRKVEAIVEKLRQRYGADQVASYYSKTDVAVEVRMS
jgi:deazaflavin-dependent oxidoreductase (nitroreductase family)